METLDRVIYQGYTIEVISVEDVFEEVTGYVVIDPDGTQLVSTYSAQFNGLSTLDDRVMEFCRGVVDSDIAEKVTLHAVHADHPRP